LLKKKEGLRRLGAFFRLVGSDPEKFRIELKFQIRPQSRLKDEFDIILNAGKYTEPKAKDFSAKVSIMKWTDVHDIAIELEDARPDEDVVNLRFTDLWKWVQELPGFDDDPDKSNEKILEAIQMAWLDERD